MSAGTRAARRARASRDCPGRCGVVCSGISGLDDLATSRVTAPAHVPERGRWPVDSTTAATESDNLAKSRVMSSARAPARARAGARTGAAHPAATSRCGGAGRRPAARCAAPAPAARPRAPRPRRAPRPPPRAPPRSSPARGAPGRAAAAIGLPNAAPASDGSASIARGREAQTARPSWQRRRKQRSAAARRSAASARRACQSIRFSSPAAALPRSSCSRIQGWVYDLSVRSLVTARRASGRTWHRRAPTAFPMHRQPSSRSCQAPHPACRAAGTPPVCMLGLCVPASSSCRVQRGRRARQALGKWRMTREAIAASSACRDLATSSRRPALRSRARE